MRDAGLHPRQARGETGRLLRRADLWVSSALAAMLVAAAVVSGVAGMLIAFGFITTGVVDPFRDGLLFLAAGLILAVSANAFRREHHMLDDAGDEPRT